MRLFILFCIFISIQEVKAQTEYSAYIAELQESFLDFSPNKKIVYLDRDQLNSQFAQVEVSKKSQATDDLLKAEIIVDYIKEKSQQEIKVANAESLLRSIKFNNYSAHPIKDLNNDPICIVVTSNPDLNQTQAHHRMLNWDLLKEKPEFKNKEIKKPLPLTVMQMLSDIHETFHCLDDEYLPEAQKSHDDYHMIHKSEVFAELSAIIYLRQKGFTDIIETRSQLREVGSTMTSKYLAGIGFDGNIPWGAIYSLQYAIRSLDYHLSDENIHHWSIKDILSFAKSVTELEALNDHEFYGLSAMMKDPSAIQETIAKNIVVDNFPFLSRRFEIVDKTVKKHRESYKESLGKLFALSSNVNPINSSSEVPTEFNLATDCPLFENVHNESELFSYVDELRQEHYLLNLLDKDINHLQLENIYTCFWSR